MKKMYFNEEIDYPEENACDNEVFRSTILHHRNIELIHASAVDLLHAVHTVLEKEILIGENADITKTKQEK